MIITRIIGGLGNQMFQYAIGRALSLEYGQPLRLDISGFSGYDLHYGFELYRVFSCSGEIATDLDVRDILGWQFSTIIRRAVARPSLATFRRNKFIIEPHFHYWPKIWNVPQSCYLFGNWQSEKYFQKVAPVIRTDFTFKTTLTSQNIQLAEKICEVNAVSLHVRRGDYIENSKNIKIYGICSLNYYRKAVQYILERVKNPYVFVFSDNVAWVREHLKIDIPHQYVDHNHDEESYLDMYLMSLCKHNIIANSSFSWWGAWLNSFFEKIVIAPANWFINNNNVKDLYPEGWVVL